MKKLGLSLCVLSSAALLSACVVASGPVAVSNIPIGNKTGEACATYIFGIYSGDNSVIAAARKIGISKVATVDYEVTVYPFVSSHCTQVTGQQ